MILHIIIVVGVLLLAWVLLPLPLAVLVGKLLRGPR